MTLNNDKNKLYFKLFLVAVGVILTLATVVYGLTVSDQKLDISKNTKNINILQEKYGSLNVLMARIDVRLGNIEDLINKKLTKSK